MDRGQKAQEQVPRPVRTFPLQEFVERLHPFEHLLFVEGLEGVRVQVIILPHRIQHSVWFHANSPPPVSYKVCSERRNEATARAAVLSAFPLRFVFTATKRLPAWS